MTRIKYRIGLGNCRPGINENITAPEIDPTKIYRADTTEITADNTILTADYSL